MQSKGIDIRLASQIQEQLGFVPSGSIYLDKIMGTRGYPYPKFVHVYGEPSTGKSLLALMSMAYITRAGGYVVYCDLENNYNSVELNAWRERFGIDLSKVIDIG